MPCPQLLAFVNAYLMLNDANRLAVFAAGSTGRWGPRTRAASTACAGRHGVCTGDKLWRICFFNFFYLIAHAQPANLRSYLLYQTANCLPTDLADALPPAGAGASPGPAILAGLQAAMETDALALSAAGGARELPTVLSAALSRVLCFVNRAQRLSAAAAVGLQPGARDADAASGAGAAADAAGGALRPRVLCLLGSQDTPSQYISVMNAIFRWPFVRVADRSPGSPACPALPCPARLLCASPGRGPLPCSPSLALPPLLSLPLLQCPTQRGRRRRAEAGAQAFGLFTAGAAGRTAREARGTRHETCAPAQAEHARAHPLPLPAATPSTARRLT